MLGDPRKNCLGLQMHAQWYLSGGRRQMHRAYAPLACWVILATGPQAAFMTGAEFSGARHRVRAFVTLTHPCQHAAAHLQGTRPPDVPYARRPARARPGARDCRHLHAFALTWSGFQTMPRHKEEDAIEDDTASGAELGGCRVSRIFGTRARAAMTPPASELPSTLDDLWAALRPPASFGVNLFEINVLHAVFAACPDVKDAGDLLILRETLLEELGPAYMWLINISLVDWASLSEEDKELNTQMRLDWLASYSKASEEVLQHWFWKLLKSKTQNFAPLHQVFVRVRPSSLNCGSDVWTEIFLLYPLTGVSITHKLLASCLQKCLAFTDDSPAACTGYIASINTSVSQLGHMKDMSVRDVLALVTLMGLYISTASGHQKAYKELLAYVDAGNTLTLDDVQHAIIQYSRSKSNRVFSVRRSDARCSNSCPRCCSSARNDCACNHRCPRCCDTRGRTPDPSSRTSSRAGSRTGSPARHVYPNFTDQDQAALTERELLCSDRGMPEETRVYASMLYRNNVVPEQVLFDDGCTDYQDEHAHIAIAEAAENLLRMGCDSTDDEDA